MRTRHSNASGTTGPDPPDRPGVWGSSEVTVEGGLSWEDADLVEELQAEAVELAVRLEEAREDLSRLEITWETVAMALAESSAAEAEPDVPAEDVPESNPAPTTPPADFAGTAMTSTLSPPPALPSTRSSGVSGPAVSSRRAA